VAAAAVGSAIGAISIAIRPTAATRATATATTPVPHGCGCNGSVHNGGGPGCGCNGGHPHGNPDGQAMDDGGDGQVISDQAVTSGQKTTGQPHRAKSQRPAGDAKLASAC